MFSVILLLIFIFLAYKVSPREKADHAKKLAPRASGRVGIIRRLREIVSGPFYVRRGHCWGDGAGES